MRVPVRVLTVPATVEKGNPHTRRIYLPFSNLSIYLFALKARHFRVGSAWMPLVANPICIRFRFSNLARIRFRFGACLSCVQTF